MEPNSCHWANDGWIEPEIQTDETATGLKKLGKRLLLVLRLFTFCSKMVSHGDSAVSVSGSYQRTERQTDRMASRQFLFYFIFQFVKAGCLLHT